MSRLRLRTQLLVANLLIICALIGALLLIVRYTVRAGIDRQVRESTSASVRAFENVQKQRELELSRTAAMLAELPTLKALMTTYDPPTIQDASAPFWKLAGSDLLLLAGPDSQILGFHMTKAAWPPDSIQEDLRHSLAQEEDSSWWYSQRRLYWVFLHPISAGSGPDRKQLGVVGVGYEVDSSVADRLALVAGSKIALAIGDRVIASTFAPAEETELEGWIARAPAQSATDGRQITLGSDRYQVASVVLHERSQAPVVCYVLVSLEQPERFIGGLNRTILVLGISAVVFAALLVSLFSRSVTSPLDDLVAGVRALASGDYAYSVTPRGSSEVAELGRAFASMRAELLESQRRWRASERISALARASSSISHDLRHYLATIVANAEFLYESDTLKLDRDEIYAEIRSTVDQMTDLLDSLRELAREGVAISPAPGALDQTIRRAIDSVRARPEMRDASFTLTTSGPMDGVFDARKIERVFFNLLLNACEAVAPAQVRVGIHACSSPASFEVRVADNGPGIPDSIRHSLFDPFVSWGKPNGTGMGLAIVNRIIQDHGGSVCVETTSASGTTFLLKFPRSLAGLDADGQLAAVPDPAQRPV
jgi:signal transduction histidine kinase